MSSDWDQGIELSLCAEFQLILQFGPKRMRDFSTICLNKNNNKKKNQKEFFDSLFSYGKLRGSSLTYFPVFVVLYTKLFENIDQKSESTIFSCYFIDMKLMTTLF